MRPPRFPLYSYDEWLPSSLKESRSDPGSFDPKEFRISLLETCGSKWKEINQAPNTQNVKAAQDLVRQYACSFFWSIYYRPDLEKEPVEKINQLWEIWKQPYEPDEEPDWIQIYVSLHLSSALLIALGETENGVSERFREVLDYATGLVQTLKANKRVITDNIPLISDEEYHEKRSLMISLPIVCSYVYAITFQLSRDEGAYPSAFESLYEARDFATKTEILTGGVGSGDDPGITHKDVGYGLVARWLPCQDAVDVFESIYKHPSHSLNWSQLATRCELLKFFYEVGLNWDQDADSNTEYVYSVLAKIAFQNGESYDPGYTIEQFWTFARGLCLSRLTPDAYREWKEADERHEAGNRLKTYFFESVWDQLPQDAKDHLINADKLYWTHEGARESLFNELRLATEAIIDFVLWKPYEEWLHRRGVKNLYQLRSSFFDQGKGTFLGYVLGSISNSQDFKRFVHETHIQRASFIFNELYRDLSKLNDARRKEEHSRSGSSPSDSSIIRGCYRQFLGIGTRGVLTQLLEISEIKEATRKAK